MKIRIAIAEDNKRFRTAFLRLMKTEEDLEFIIEAENGADLLLQLESKIPDIILLDIPSEQMSLVQGKGCSIFAWIAAVAADIACAVAEPFSVWACVAAAGTSADCLSQLDLSSSGSSSPTGVGPDGLTSKGAPKY